MAGQDDSNWGRGLTAGVEFAVGVGLGCVVGRWIDGRLHSAPWGMLVGILIGVAAGMYLLLKSVNAMNKD